LRVRKTVGILKGFSNKFSYALQLAFTDFIFVTNKKIVFCRYLFEW